MSAFSVGTQTSAKNAATQANENRKPPNEGPGKAFIKWIPGDAIVFYTALLAAGATQPPTTGNETPEQLLTRIDAGSFGWFVFALISTAVLVAIGAAIPSGMKGREKVAFKPLALRIILTLVAFTLWTSLLPGAWAYSLNVVRDLGPAYVLVITVVAVIFTALAEALTRQTNS